MARCAVVVCGPALMLLILVSLGLGPTNKAPAFDADAETPTD